MGILKYHMDQIVKNLEAQRYYFNNLSKMHPPGTLQIRSYKGNSRFVHSSPLDGDHGKCRRRIISGDEKMLRAFACGQYGRAAMSIIEHNEKVLGNVSDELIDLTPDNIRERLPRIYKELPGEYFTCPSDITCSRTGELSEDLQCITATGFSIDGLYTGSETPITRADMKKWAETPYRMTDYRPDERTKETSRGLKVRSKSEVLVCEKLYEYDIPFRYEQEILVGRYSLAPDFTFLDSNGEEFYLEYCGMMSDQNYIDRHLWKRKLYESAGIYEWDNLIYFFEKDNTINVRMLDGMIRVQILPRIGDG